MAVRPRRSLLLALALSASLTASASADPGTAIDSGPETVVTKPDVLFAFSSTEDGSTFECALTDANGEGAFKPCTSPHALHLSDGDYTFRVRAADQAGNVDPTPASRTFAVDTTNITTSIEAGPSGTTRDGTPSFKFASNTAGATYQCKISGAGSTVADWAECSPPWAPPALGSGRYVLYARAVSPEGRSGRPASRSFAVDADAPETNIADGPPAGGSTGTRTPRFIFTSEDGATFECRWDNKHQRDVDTAGWTPCPMFYAAPELKGGQHVLEVRATDAVGNPDATPATRTFTVAVCEQVVRFDLLEATADCLRTGGTPDAPRWESTGPVKVNGLSVPAPAGGRIVLEGPSAGSGGAIDVQNVHVEVLGLTVFDGHLRMDFPQGGGPATSANDVQEKALKTLHFGTGEDQVLGLKVNGDGTLRMGRRGSEHYYLAVDAHVALPEIFRSGPQKGAGGLTGDVAILIDKDGVHPDGAKLAITNAYLGPLGVRYACLSYVAALNRTVNACETPLGTSFLVCPPVVGADRWDGALDVMLTKDLSLAMWGGLAAGRLSYAGLSLDASAGGRLIPLAPGADIDRLAVGACFEPPPLQIKGQIGFGFGPTIDGKRATRVDGSVHYIAADPATQKPWSLEMAGAVQFFGFPGPSARVKVQPSVVDFEAALPLKFGSVTIDANASGWVEFGPKGRFNIEGGARICTAPDACAGGSLIASSIGAGACATFTVAALPTLVKDKRPAQPADWDWLHPWRMHWEGKPVELTTGATYRWVDRSLELGLTCSFDRVKVSRDARAIRRFGDPRTRAFREYGARAITGAGSELSVGEGEPARAFLIHGAGAPPRVALVGPGGRRIETPASGGAMVNGQYVIAQDPGQSTTSIVVAKPEAGDWKVEAMDGSAAITGVEAAAPSPAPTVSGGVGGRGHARTLSYGYAAREGQKITFVERGPKTQQTLGAAAGTPCPGTIEGRGDGRRVLCGKLPFEPGRGPAGGRRIVAVIEQNGIPSKNVVVARYTAPAELRPVTPRKLRVRRRADRLVIAWKGSPSVDRYNVLVDSASGSRKLFFASARHPQVVLRGNDSRYGTRVVVTPMRTTDNVTGKSATVVVKAARAKLRRDRAALNGKRIRKSHGRRR